MNEPEMTSVVPSKYRRTIHEIGGSGRTILVDVYAVLEAFATGSPAIDHAVKKLLCAGTRGAKSLTTDLAEAIVSIQRALENETGILNARELAHKSPVSEQEGERAKCWILESRQTEGPHCGVTTWKLIDPEGEEVAEYRDHVRACSVLAYLNGNYPEHRHIEQQHAKLKGLHATIREQADEIERLKGAVTAVAKACGVVDGSPSAGFLVAVIEGWKKVASGPPVVEYVAPQPEAKPPAPAEASEGSKPYPGNPPDDSGDWEFNQEQGVWFKRRNTVPAPAPAAESGDKPSETVSCLAVVENPLTRQWHLTGFTDQETAEHAKALVDRAGDLEELLTQAKADRQLLRSGELCFLDPAGRQRILGLAERCGISREESEHQPLQNVLAMIEKWFTGMMQAKRVFEDCINRIEGLSDKRVSSLRLMAYMGLGQHVQVWESGAGVSLADGVANFVDQLRGAEQ